MNLSANHRRRRFRRRLYSGRTSGGFSLVEILVGIALAGVIVGIAFVSLGGSNDSTRKTRLESNVATLNQAIDIYLASGGSLDGLTTPSDILAKLKTTRSTADIKTHIGAASGMQIDPRIVAVWDDSEIATSESPLAVYDTASNQFKMITSGVGGVSSFLLDPSLNEYQGPVEARDGDVFAYNSEDGWVWDSQNVNNPDAISGPTSISTSNPIASSAPPSTDTSSTDDGDDTTDTDGTTNTDDGDDGGGGGDSGDDGTDDSEETDDDDGSDPDPVETPEPTTLARPVFSMAAGGYVTSEFPLNVSIENTATPGTGQTLYQLGNSAWQIYSGAPISVPANTQLRAFNQATDEAYADSRIRSAFYYPVVASFSGSTSGEFKNPVAGGGVLASEISDDGSFFSHGDPTIDLGGETIDAGTTNTLSFIGTSISSDPGAWFTVGELQYHNGTTFNDTHATFVELDITINLSSPSLTLETTLQLDLINTENTTDANASADSVRISGFSDVDFSVEGTSYTLELEFGGTDSFGFTNGNQFFVFEGATGRGEISGRFVDQ